MLYNVSTILQENREPEKQLSKYIPILKKKKGGEEILCALNQ